MTRVTQKLIQIDNKYATHQEQKNIVATTVIVADLKSTRWKHYLKLEKRNILNENADSALKME